MALKNQRDLQYYVENFNIEDRGLGIVCFPTYYSWRRFLVVPYGVALAYRFVDNGPSLNGISRPFH